MLRKPMSKALTVRPNKAIAVRDSLDLYFRGLRETTLLSRVEERSLADRWYFDRDPEAGRQLVVSNLRFVVKIAKEYAKYGVRLPDLIQEGNMGLLHAVDKFDPRKGFRLISYAVWWIRAYIQSFILKSWSVVRLGTTRAQRRIFNGLQKARRMISSFNADQPVEKKQLAQKLNVSEAELDETMHRMKVRDVSIDQPVSKNSETPFGESLADETPSVEDRVVSSDLQEKVRDRLDTAYEDLSPRERYLLENRLMSEDPVTLQAAGHEFGVSRERVRQIEVRLKEKLRTILAPTVGATALAAA